MKNNEWNKTIAARISNSAKPKPDPKLVSVFESRGAFHDSIFQQVISDV